MPVPSWNNITLVKVINIKKTLINTSYNLSYKFILTI